jgi:hypothetical protein
MSTQENVPHTRAGNDFNHCLPATVNEPSLQAHGFTVETTGHSWIESEFEWHDELVVGEVRLAVTRPGARHQQVRIGLALQGAGEVFDLRKWKSSCTFPAQWCKSLMISGEGEGIEPS